MFVEQTFVNVIAIVRAVYPFGTRFFHCFIVNTLEAFFAAANVTPAQVHTIAIVRTGVIIHCTFVKILAKSSISFKAHHTLAGEHSVTVVAKGQGMTVVIFFSDKISFLSETICHFLSLSDTGTLVLIIASAPALYTLKTVSTKT